VLSIAPRDSWSSSSSEPPPSRAWNKTRKAKCVSAKDKEFEASMKTKMLIKIKYKKVISP